MMDVFSSISCKGNPVAVVNCMSLSENEISTETMQSIANWTNLSETTFLFKPTNSSKADYKLRIFSPISELPFAGHPTIGSCKAFLQFSKQDQSLSLIRQECGVGIVELENDLETEILLLRAERTSLDKIDENVAKLYQESLKVDPIDSPYLLHVGPEWVVFLVKDAETCYNANPNFAEMRDISLKYGHTGIILAGPKHKTTDEKDSATLKYEMRAFAPAINVSEDPVCGSGSIALIRYLQNKYNFTETKQIEISQGGRIGRDGHISAKINISSNDITYHCGGNASCIINGSINL